MLPGVSGIEQRPTIPRRSASTLSTPRPSGAGRWWRRARETRPTPGPISAMPFASIRNVRATTFRETSRGMIGTLRSSWRVSVKPGAASRSRQTATLSGLALRKSGDVPGLGSQSKGVAEVFDGLVKAYLGRGAAAKNGDPDKAIEDFNQGRVWTLRTFMLIWPGVGYGDRRASSISPWTTLARSCVWTRRTCWPTSLVRRSWCKKETSTRPSTITTRPCVVAGRRVCL